MDGQAQERKMDVGGEGTPREVPLRRRTRMQNEGRRQLQGVIKPRSPRMASNTVTAGRCLSGCSAFCISLICRFAEHPETNRKIFRLNRLLTARTSAAGDGVYVPIRSQTRSPAMFRK